jgi:hypothetical protein
MKEKLPLIKLTPISGTISLSKTTEIGVPLLSKSYWKPTPKFWRVIGDSLASLGTLGTILGIKNPVFAIVCALSGWLGKIITNSISNK